MPAPGVPTSGVLASGLQASQVPRLLALLALLLVASALAAGTASLEAQQVERERQEAVAPELGVVEIDRSLRTRLDLFGEVEGFRVARLFLRDDGTAVLEIESRPGEQVLRERRLLDDAELAAFRADLEARFQEMAVGPLVGQDGRGGLVLRQTLLGLAYHGWAVPVALDIDSAQGAVATYLLTAGASFYLPYRLTRDRPVTRVHRDLAAYGGTRGIGAGVLLADALSGNSTSGSSRARLAGGVLVSWGGTVAGYQAAQRFQPDEGTAALWSAMGDLGFASGALSAYAAGPYVREEVEVTEGGVTFTDRRLRNRRLGHAMTLAGGAAGLATGGWLGGRMPMTEGNVTVLRSGSVLGAQVGLTSVRLGTDDGRALASGAVVGALGGTALAAPWLRDRHFSEGEGLLVAAGHLAGGATALGVTYLLVEDIDERGTTYLVTSTLGSLVGAGLVARALDPGSAPPPLRRPGSGGAAGNRGGVSVELHPAGVLQTLLGSVQEDRSPGRSRNRDAPILTLRF